MDRRNAIKGLAVAYGTIISLPFWIQSCGLSDNQLHQSSFSPAEQDMLAQLCDTVIPPGNAVGALSVGVDKFLQKLFDDCYEQEVRDNVRKQIQLLRNKATATCHKPFSECKQSEKEQLFMSLARSGDKQQQAFFDLLKSEIIRGFNTSQLVMEKYQGYKVAPGHYFGCVTVNV